jgi:subtilisin family serine protease
VRPFVITEKITLIQHEIFSVICFDRFVSFLHLCFISFDMMGMSIVVQSYVERPMSRKYVLAFILLFITGFTLSMVSSAQNNIPGGVATHIIEFEDPLSSDAMLEFAASYELDVTHMYFYALNGMAAIVPDGVLNDLQNDSQVAMVEANQEVQLFAQSTPTGIDRVYAASNLNIDIDGVDDYRVDVDIAVIDTGVSSHDDLNLVSHVDCTGGTCANGGTDGNGHGTHVAGTIGALDNDFGVVGVAPGARIHGVQVMDNSGIGYISQIIAGIDYVTGNAETIEVANMALGFSGYSIMMDAAVRRAVNAGVVVVVAAGNSSKDASNYSPAQFEEAITVSAMADFNGLPGGGASATCRPDEDDTLANFSNAGSAVDITAPGLCILSTWTGGNYQTLTGTSMASAHVAGAAGLLTSGASDPQDSSDVQDITSTLLSEGNLNWTDDSGDGIQEPLLDLSNTLVIAPALIATGGGGTGTVYIGDLDGNVNYYSYGYYWRATVSALVLDGNGNAVSGADVTMDATGAVNGSGTCTTGTNGRCSLTTGWITKGSSQTYSITNVSVSGYTYDSSLNTDPDGDSNGTTITIFR